MLDTFLLVAAAIKATVLFALWLALAANAGQFLCAMWLAVNLSPRSTAAWAGGLLAAAAVLKLMGA